MKGMTLEKRIEAFAALGLALNNLTTSELEGVLRKAEDQNPWFTPESTRFALEGIQHFLNKEMLSRWTQGYLLDQTQEKAVGIIMAGNIPLVGFHDMLSVLIAGHKLQAKLSSQDSFLPQFVASVLGDIAPELRDQITFPQQSMKSMDAVIATGSNNSSRYFEHYFGKYPHIIRKNRTSVGILKGTESVEEMVALGKDVFTYFGLGCRNVSKLFVPEGYNFTPLLDAWQVYQPIINHHKYSNNYDYHKSILLVNGEDHLDTGFLILREEKALAAPTTMLYYEHYQDTFSLSEKLASEDGQIQCLVGNGIDHPRGVGFGQSQQPQLWDYADGVDTLSFLSSLK